MGPVKKSLGNIDLYDGSSALYVFGTVEVL